MHLDPDVPLQLSPVSMWHPSMLPSDQLTKQVLAFPT